MITKPVLIIAHVTYDESRKPTDVAETITGSLERGIEEVAIGSLTLSPATVVFIEPT